MSGKKIGNVTSPKWMSSFKGKSRQIFDKNKFQAKHNLIDIVHFVENDIIFKIVPLLIRKRVIKFSTVST